MASPLGVTASRRKFTEWAAACDDPELRSNFEQTEAMWHGLLEALIQGEIADGIPPFTPHNVNLILSACVDGVLVATGLTPEHSDPEAVVSTSLALWDLVKAHCAERRTH